MLFRAATPVGLESAFGHERCVLLIHKIAVRQRKSINDTAPTQQTREWRTPRQREKIIADIASSLPVGRRAKFFDASVGTISEEVAMVYVKGNVQALTRVASEMENLHNSRCSYISAT